MKILVVYKKNDDEYDYYFKTAGVSGNKYINLYMLFSCKKDLFTYITRLEFSQKNEVDFYSYKDTKLELECLKQAYKDW